MRTLLLVFTLCASLAHADDATRRLDNLQALADVWGRVYLFHPRVVADGLEWEKALVEAIPVVEAAKTEEELVAAIEKTLLARINDDDVRVFRRNASAPAPSGPTGTIESRVIAPGVGLIAMRDPNVTADPKFLERFAEAYRGLGEIKQLVLDLRWPDVQHSPDAPADAVLRFFTDRAVTTGGTLRRQHSGWNERQDPSAYAQNWVVEAGWPILPITERGPFSRSFPDIKVESLPIIKTPTLIIINNHSAASMGWTLDALQHAGHVRVAWEKRGGTPRSPWATGVMPLGKEHELYIPDAMLLSLNGGLGFRANFESTTEIDVAEALARAGELKPVPMFSFGMKFPPKAEVSDTLTREQRIAGLIKLVTIVNQFDPHLEYASPAWKTVLRDRIPRVEAAATAKDYFTELRRATAPLNDSHVGITHRSLVAARTPLPAELRSGEGRVVVMNVAEGVTALKPGDELLSIDGKTIAQIEAEARELTSLSTPNVLLRNLWTAGRAGWGEKDSRARLVVMRDGKREDVEVTRIESPKFPPKQVWRRLDHNLGYINLFEAANMAALDDALKELSGTSAIIFDLRGYPKFWITRDLVARLAEQTVRSTKFVIPIITTADENSQTWQTMQYVVEPHESIRYRKPIAVLINESTQSMPEDFSIYLENAKRATFIGSQTAGTNGNITTVDLPGGGRMTFTGMRVLFDDGTRFQNIGIVPDVVVKPTFAGLKAGRDEVLEKAVEVMSAQR